ncbi:nucleoside deaminase [Agriterribacter sp.]|uniref:nucleoside deaminase n=1 Tax=Agriterribacter sp. TaxID=2821509 RepID=UPI002B9437BD|nr:nucleoside deaminase [Agriterribacter sp.]HRP56141.1 nucleoside deaminase [Agriterribacter sp.]
MKSDSYYMERCRLLGKAAAARGNSPVGAIIIKAGEIVSEAEEAGKSKNDITCHAELEAVRFAVAKLKTNDLSGCVMYTTHEPCVMCSYAIRFYKIKKVVFQNTVQYLGGVGSSMPLLTASEVPPHWGKAPEVVHLTSE